MVNVSFSLPSEKFRAVDDLNRAESAAAGGKDIPMSQTLSLLVQRGLAYTLLLKEKTEESKTPEQVTVKRKHRNKKW